MLSRALWAIGAVLSFALFYVYMPLTVYSQMSFFIALLGGFVTSLCGAQALLNFKSIQHAFPPKESRKPGAHNLWPLLVIFPTFVLGFVFFMHFFTRKDAALKANGVTVTATIVDGESVTRRRSTSCSVDIRFTDQNGKVHKVNETVSCSDFNNLHKGAEIQIVYLPDDPSTVSLLTDQDKAAEFLGIENRPIAAQDLIFVDTTTNAQAITDYLNKVSTEWTYQKREYSEKWTNALLKESITKSRNRVNFLQQSAGYIIEQQKGFSMEGFERTQPQAESGQKVYKSDAYMLTTKREMIPSQIGFSIGFSVSIKKL